MSLSITITGVDTSNITWLYVTQPVREAIYVYQERKGAAKGAYWRQGTNSATFSISGRCARNATNSATVTSMSNAIITVVSTEIGTWTGVITGAPRGKYNPVWINFTVNVMET